MPHKNKNQLISDSLRQTGQKLGIVLMAGAATLGMLELPDHPNRVALTLQPVYTSINESPELNNPLRREREEETAAHFLSYGVVQRSHATTGKK